MDRIYQGIRDRRGMPEVYVIDSTRRRTLHQQMFLAPPMMYDWGYPGEDAENLALSLLADALEGGDHPLVDEQRERLCRDVVSMLPAEGWQIRQSKLVEWAFGRLDYVPVEKLPLDALGGGVNQGWN